MTTTKNMLLALTDACIAVGEMPKALTNENGIMEKIALLWPSDDAGLPAFSDDEMVLFSFENHTFSCGEEEDYSAASIIATMYSRLKEDAANIGHWLQVLNAIDTSG